MTDPLEDWARSRLAALEGANLRRHLAPPAGVDLTSNDYLGLSTHPRLREALHEALATLPHGGTSSRLLRGHHPAWADLEAGFAAWQGTEAALTFATGFAANLGWTRALVQPEDLVVSDALNHASLIDGLRATGARRVIVPHRDLDAVAAALADHAGRAWVVVESLYSMDGDTWDLHALAAVCARHGAWLVVDEAHATGLYGPQGEGLIAEAGVREAVALSIHTGGKALGLTGAWVCASRSVVDLLVQAARAFVFSTALPPFLAPAIASAVALIRDDPSLRARPGRRADRLRARLDARWGDTGDRQIVPLVTGSAASALALQRHLAHRGWDARAVRPPTVPDGTSRVRLVMRAGLSEDAVDRLAADLAEAPS